MLRHRVAGGIAGCLVVLTTAACTDSFSYDEHVEYLRTTVQRGVETHRLLVSQAAQPTVERCGAAFDGTVTDIPADVPETRPSRVSEQWLEQVRAFFIDSCVSGKPRPIPADGSPPVAPPTVRSTT